MPDNLYHTILGKLAIFEMGQSPDSYFVGEEEKGIPFLQGSAEFGSIYPHHILYCSQPKKTCKRGDILISVRAPVGTINKSDRIYCIGRGLAAIQFINCLPEFGWHLLAYWVKDFRKVSQGTTFEAIGKAELTNLSVINLPEPFIHRNPARF